MQFGQKFSVGCGPVAAAGSVKEVWVVEATNEASLEVRSQWTDPNQEVNIHRAPPIKDPCESRLLRVVRYMWAKAVDRTAIMTIGT